MFRTACVLSVVLAISAGAFADYSSELLKLNPDAYWRMNEVDPTPGATLVNYGTLGEAGNGQWGFTDQPDSMPIAVVNESANTAFPGLGSNNQMAQFINNDPATTAYHQFNLGPNTYMNNENQTYSFMYRRDGDASTDGERLIINNQLADNDFRVILYGYRIVVCTGTSNNVNQTAATSTDVSFINQWHHFVVVRNGDLAWQAKVYVDGVEYPLNTPPDSFSKYGGDGYANIGARFPYDNWGNYTGFVDEVATWGRALTSEEVTSLYTAAITPIAEPNYRAGDTDKNLNVDPADLMTLLDNWAPTATDKVWEQGDFDTNGNVDPADLMALLDNWSPTGYTPVPEPATMALLSIGGLALIRRRK